MKILIDTNIFIRFATRDDEKKSQDCRIFFELIEKGLIKPYVSFISLFEINFLLIKYYHFAKEKTLDYIESVVNMRNMIILKNIDVLKILKAVRQSNLGFADAVIVTQMKKDFVLCTYDAKLGHYIKKSKRPEEIKEIVDKNSLVD